MTTNVTVTDGHIDGYLSIEEFAKQHGVTAHAVRKAIERGQLHPLAIDVGKQARYWFPEDYKYSAPKRGRPFKQDNKKEK